MDAIAQGVILGRVEALDLGGPWLVPRELAATEELAIEGSPGNLEALARTTAPRLRRLTVGGVVRPEAAWPSNLRRRPRTQGWS